MKKKRALTIVALALLFILSACTAVVTVTPVTGDLEVKLNFPEQLTKIVTESFRYTIKVTSATTLVIKSGNAAPGSSVTVRFENLPPDYYTVEVTVYYEYIIDSTPIISTPVLFTKSQNVLVKSGDVTKIELTINYSAIEKPY